jgi:hypothetical protein
MLFMERKIVMILCLLAAFTCISCASGYQDPFPGDPDLKASWLWSYAYSNSEEQLEDADVLITDYDITYGRGRVADAEKDCSNMGGVWCTYAQEDRDTLQRMLNVKARQTNNPSPEQVDRSPIPDFTNIIDSAWKQLAAFPSMLENWVNDLMKALNSTPKPHST